MRSSVEIVAERRAGGTVLRRLRAGGHVALRQTGPAQVHMVGTAAGPLGGDVIEIRIEVGPGAELTVRGVAATILLPGAHRPDSAIGIAAGVAEAGRLDLALRPAVVCAGAEHVARTELRLAAGARADLVEEVVLGRAGEPGGRWTGRTTVTRDGRPVLRQTLCSDFLGVPGRPARALVARLTLPPGEVPPSGATTSGSAVLLPLAAGGTLATATGPDLSSARQDLAVLLSGEPRPAGAQR